MKITKKIKRKLIYFFTKKPTHYVHIDHPKTWQDERQLQYNKWCKAKKVYNGSYLPTNPDTLNYKGWKEITSKHDKTGKHRLFRQKSSGQVVTFHDKKMTNRKTIADEHYHWFELISFEDMIKESKNKHYHDRYGKLCKKNTKESHLAPLDKAYVFK